MSDFNKISAAFNKFVGREIGVKEVEVTLNFPNLGIENMKMTECHLEENDPAVAELTQAAKEARLQLRIWLPGSVGTMDFRTDRLNASVEKDDKGTYRFSHFSIG